MTLTAADLRWKQVAKRLIRFLRWRPKRDLQWLFPSVDVARLRTIAHGYDVEQVNYRPIGRSAR